MKRAALLLSILAACAHTETVREEPAPEEPAGPRWVALFNGRDLDGWTPKITGYPLGENFADTFRVEDGLLRVSYDGYEAFDGRFGHLFFEAPLAHYKLRVVYRFHGEQCPGGPGWAFRNSGVMLHGQTPESMALDQDFPASIEAQMLGGGAEGERPNANLCTPGTNVVMDGELIRRHCINSSSRTYRGDEWVTLELEVRGNEVIRHWLDGQVVLEYSQPQLDERDGDAQKLLAAGADVQLAGGTISLQSESHPIDFKSVELLVLAP